MFILPLYIALKKKPQTNKDDTNQLQKWQKWIQLWFLHKIHEGFQVICQKPEVQAEMEMDLFNMPKCCSNRRTRVLEKNIENLDLNTLFKNTT